LIEDVYVLDLSQFLPGDEKKLPEWERRTSLGQAPGLLSNISMAEANGVIYIFGSSHNEEGEPKSVLWAYDTSKSFSIGKDTNCLIK